METNQERREKTDMEKIAGENFALWAKALLTKDPAKVAKLYAGDNTFLPTMSPDFKQGMPEAENYFKHFLQKNPEGRIVQGVVQLLGENTYLHSGMYDFKLNENGSSSVVQARFSFVWRRDPDNGKWKIIHHHSSVRPQ